MKKTGVKKLVPIIVVAAIFLLVLLNTLKSNFFVPRLLDRNVFLTDGVNAKSLFNKTTEAVCLSLLEASKLNQSYEKTVIDYPFDKSIFPSEIVAPTFLWHDPNPKADLWLIDVAFTDNSNHIYVLSSGKRPELVIDPRAISESNKHYKPSDYDVSAKGWVPDKRTWSIIKHNSIEKSATVSVIGFDSKDTSKLFSKGVVRLLTSKDPVGAPIFYRDVPLMPSQTKQGTIKPIAESALPLISWKLRDISKAEAATVLSDMPTCANCHTFSFDGKVLGMDLDGPDGDKGAYALANIKKKTTVTWDDIVTWNSFEPKSPPGHKSFGLFSHVSPDGEHVISTVNESVFVENYTKFEFLQSFYPTRGIFAVYHRETDTMKALGGADDPNYVHTNACWSPDGKYLVFSRAPSKDNYEGDEHSKYSGDPKETFIQYDLYRMPFNDGKGGIAEPIKGAVNNGMSNSFPRYSPDGKWIVFVQSQKGQLMRPDSKLYIIEAGGSEVRELNSNLPLMNSWHSWSPNSRWLVFASKGFRPFTQMFLTHIDEDGNSSPAILVPNSTAANRAVNIPEFINNKPDAIGSIYTPTQVAYRYKKAGDEFVRLEEYKKAVKKYKKAIDLNHYFDDAYLNLGAVLATTGKIDEAIMYYRKTIEIDDENAMAHSNLGLALSRKGRLEEAIIHFTKAQEIDPNFGDSYLGRATTLNKLVRYDEALLYFRKAYELHHNRAKVVRFMVPFLIRRATALRKRGESELALEYYREALSIKEDDVKLRYKFAASLHGSGNFKEAAKHYREAIKINPDFVPATNDLAWLLSTSGDAEVRNGSEAIELAQKACRLTDYQNSFTVYCLAAAYAESGRFSEAVGAAEEAFELARLSDQKDIRMEIKRAIEQFKNGEPIREEFVKQ